MRLTAGQQLGPYEVVAPLGAGGMGEVYRAVDRRLGRSVALKVLPSQLADDEDRTRRFIGEARAASALNHPNVATIYDVGESGGVSFIAMEYVEGRTLGDSLGDTPMGRAAIVTIATQVVDALEAAHAQGITHRDIKPANLMLTPKGQVKVLDFGLAKSLESEAQATGDGATVGSPTAVGVVMGTVDYMSPEQALGRAVDHRSDLFSIGVVLYQMATGRLPFPGSSVVEAVGLLLHVQPEAITRFNTGVPAELDRIVRKCLEKDVERRYQSARDLLVDLRNLKRDSDATDLRPAAIDVVRRHNLLGQLTSFVGRVQERAEVQRLLFLTRLLTMTGAGGCGKTRLALQVAADVIEHFKDGVWFVDLAPLADGDLLPQTVATVLGIRKPPEHSFTEALAGELSGQQLLLVMDNCEHLIDATAQLVEMLLRATPQLRILATSREGLGVPGETVWRVPSLSVPDPSQPIRPESLLEFEAARLFVDRALAVDSAFAVTASSAATIAEVCLRLDGIPLAIELAAARLNVLSLDQINGRLKDRFRLLTGGSRTAVARQRTLEATVDWSYELLAEPERQLLCRLSIFPAGWTLEAAEEVCSGDPIERDDMLDHLSRLVDKSLVSVEPASDVDPAAGRRYRFLETVRQYGRERLLRSGEAEQARDRHLAFFLAMARRVEPELTQVNQALWLNRVQLVHDDIRSALDWSLATPERAEMGLELAARLWWFWTKRGHFAEARQRLERALAAAPASSPGLRAKAFIGLGHMTAFEGDNAATTVVLDQSLVLAREAGDLSTTALTLGFQALIAAETGDFAQCGMLAAEGLAAAVESGHPWFQCLPLRMLAYGAERAGDHDRAGRLFEEAIAILRQRAEKWGLGILLGDLAGLRLLQDRYPEARALGREAILLCEELGDRRAVAWSLGTLATTQAAAGRSDRAARLWGASAGALDSLGVAPQLTVKRVQDRFIDVAKASMGEQAFQAASSQGRAMSLKQAVQFALDDR
jgi:non-specific serine/threonine protein kinase